ncbi:MAG: hypothetical protein ACTHJ5_16770 [Ilyomonas sp.]
MPLINRIQLLNSLIKHETLTIDDLAKEENMGMIPDKEQLKILLNELRKSGHILQLNGVNPFTYTISDTGVADGKRRKKEILDNNAFQHIPGGGEMDTVSTILDDLKQKNQDNEFSINEHGWVALKGKVYKENEIKIIRTYRFEGNSDPADAAIIYLVATNDGIVGYSLDAYGVYSNYRGAGYANTINAMGTIKFGEPR